MACDHGPKGSIDERCLLCVRVPVEQFTVKATVTLRYPGDCWCHDCNDKPELGFSNPTLQRMILCPSCGNKRCPRASSHLNACTNSNAPNQPGSVYGGRP